MRSFLTRLTGVTIASVCAAALAVTLVSRQNCRQARQQDETYKGISWGVREEVADALTAEFHRQLEDERAKRPPGSPISGFMKLVAVHPADVTQTDVDAHNELLTMSKSQK
jgi:hypothetical protein